MDKSLRFLFRCDCNKDNGFGHFSRCLSLARTILLINNEVEILFIGNYNQFALSLLERNKFQALNYDDAKTIDSFTLINVASNFDYLILDSYHFNQEFLNTLVGNKFKLIAIDDFNTLDYNGFDMVINFTIGADKFKYSSKHNALGTLNFIAKPELIELREKNLLKSEDQIKNILLFLSGTEKTFNESKELLRIIDECFNNVSIDYLTSIDQPIGFISINNNTIQKHKPVYEIEKYYAETDLIISGGGMMNYESAYCCIPNLTFTQISEQQLETKNMEKENLTFEIGSLFDFNPKYTKERLQFFLNDRDFKLRFLHSTKHKFKTDSTLLLAERLMTL